MSQKILQVEKEEDIRFSAVDSMGFVWHGNDARYFEDARELSGQPYLAEQSRLTIMRLYA